MAFEVPVSKANELFDADFSVYTHEQTGLEVIRTMSYSIPADLQGHLDLVHPTITSVPILLLIACQTTLTSNPWVTLTASRIRTRTFLSCPRLSRQPATHTRTSRHALCRRRARARSPPRACRPYMVSRLPAPPSLLTSLPSAGSSNSLPTRLTSRYIVSESMIEAIADRLHHIARLS